MCVQRRALGLAHLFISYCPCVYVNCFARACLQAQALTLKPRKPGQRNLASLANRRHDPQIRAAQGQLEGRPRHCRQNAGGLEGSMPPHVHDDQPAMDCRRERLPRTLLVSGDAQRLQQQVADWLGTHNNQALDDQRPARRKRPSLLLARKRKTRSTWRRWCRRRAWAKLSCTLSQIVED